MIEIAKADKIYLNPKDGKPYYKKIAEEGIKLMHQIKTNKLRIISLLICDKCKKNKEIEIIIRMLSGEK
ncbi:hypothetical protein ACFL43_04110 [Thermodesulfobacteriota bacterium]